MKILAVRLARIAHRGTIVALLIACMLLASPAAMAQRKKKEEAEEPTKSYVLPYFIVMMLVGVGIMTVIRPGSRKNQVEEKKRNEEG